ncbi:MAG: hypothetical protein RL557_51 [archaeon]|jgi:predicted nucleotidyltransferase
MTNKQESLMEDFSEEIKARNDFFVYQDEVGEYGSCWRGWYNECEELLSDVKILVSGMTFERADEFHIQGYKIPLQKILN